MGLPFLAWNAIHPVKTGRAIFIKNLSENGSKGIAKSPFQATGVWRTSSPIIVASEGIFG